MTDQECFKQLMDERQQMAVEALLKLSTGLGGEREIRILAAEIGVTEDVFPHTRKELT